MGHIFISYSHKDTNYVHKLQKALQNEGFDVWIDDRIDYGTTWPTVIQRNLDACSAFVIVMSENAYESKWVHNEVARAERKKKPFFILLLSGDTWLSFEAIQYEDVTGEKLPSKKFYDGLARVIPSFEKKDPQEIELKNLESQAIRYELKGDFWNASKTWYEIKRIDPLFPRVDIKIRELERELRPRPVKESVTKALPFLRIASFAGIAVVLFWVGLWAMPKLSSFFTTAKPSATAPSTPTKRPIVTNTPYPTATSDAKGVTMILVSAGEFHMGSNEYPDERPFQPVDLGDFYIDKFEVTNRLYKACVDDGFCDVPEIPERYNDPFYKNHPVVYVDWNMANTYCVWRGDGTRLPTEEEWEKAARGTDWRTYPWGEELDERKANYNNNVGRTSIFSDYPNGISPYGVNNMAGNVMEWVDDWYNFYSGGSPDASSAFGEKFRVLRGGAWNYSEEYIRSADRTWRAPDFFADYIGFRCVRNVTP